ncbi:hypothetical protein BB560_006379 [Smittium megazygosporum]|uniref:Peptidase S8/S53 domain-containing protein n=1 Tax=Smittium megazygosporum TaxID=133381 RepID=A0A2T9Y7N6_9FUNG|nr:hypothetical protein BB560_006379 [Smittium megazygosporum]
MKLVYILFVYSINSAFAQTQKYLVSFKNNADNKEALVSSMNNSFRSFGINGINNSQVNKSLSTLKKVNRSLYTIQADNTTAKGIKSNSNVRALEPDVSIVGDEIKQVPFQSVPGAIKQHFKKSKSIDLDSIIVNAVPSPLYNFDSDPNNWLVQRYPPWHLGRLASIGATPQNFFPYGQEYYYLKAKNDVVVYLLDSGVDPNVPELSGKVRLGSNFISGEDNVDYAGHGTAIASLIGGKYNGVFKDAKIVSVKVLDKTNSGSTSVFLNAFDWVLNDLQENYPSTPAIINFSINYSGESALLEAVFQEVYKQGILSVNSAGNYKTDACSYSPTKYDSVLSVGSFGPQINSFDNDFSNYGPCVDVLAPGSFILVSGPGNKGMGIVNGTSLAAGIVTGLGAMILSYNPGFKSEDLKNAIIKSAITNQVVNVPDNTTTRSVWNGFKGSKSTFTYL